jgi:transcriptional regulator with XRE-family HTH domain
MPTKYDDSDIEICLLKSIGVTILKRRTALDLSQEELAEKARLHRTYISDLERGRRNPSVLTLFRVSQGLGLSLPDLLADVEPASAPGPAQGGDLTEDMTEAMSGTANCKVTLSDVNAGLNWQ